MRYKISNILLLFLFFILITSFAENRNNRAIKVVSSYDGKALQGQYGGTNHAVIIGINKYSNHPDLETAVHDVRELSSILEEKYFFKKENIILLTDYQATRENIIKQFEDLIMLKVKQGDNVFIYYAGHGWFDKIFQIGYWVTTEATKSKTTFLQNNTVYQTIAALNNKKVRHIFLVSDSCFSGNFIRKHRDIETVINDEYFNQYYSRPSRNILTSGGNEVVSDQGKEGHSVFAFYFLQQLKNNLFPYISAKQLGYEVEKMVTRNSNQKPISKFIHGVGDEDGQFFFINKYSNNEYQNSEFEKYKLPDEREESFDDLLTKAKDKERAVNKWTAWQDKMKNKFKQLKEIEKNIFLSSEDKLIACNRFLKDISKQNPFSSEDDKMRSYVEKQITYWKTQKKQTTTHKKTYNQPNEIGKDGPFIAYENGTVLDTRSGLMWASKDNGVGITWYDAKRYCENYNGGGYYDWRMPTVDELKMLFDKSKSYEMDCDSKYSLHITRLIHISCWGVWASGTLGMTSSPGYFNFYNTGYSWIHKSRSGGDDRALPVRSDK